MAHKRINLSQISSGILVPVLILGAGLVGYFMLLPKFEEARQGQRTLQAKRSRTLGQASQFTSVKSLIFDLKDKKPDLGFLDQAMPDSPAIPELLANLDDLARHSGVLIDKLNLKPKGQSGKSTTTGQVSPAPVYPPGLEIMQIEISIKGGYNNLKAFLLNVEQNLRLLDVESINVGAAEAKTGAQEYSFLIDTYYQNPNGIFTTK